MSDTGWNSDTDMRNASAGKTSANEQSICGFWPTIPNELWTRELLFTITELVMNLFLDTESKLRD